MNSASTLAVIRIRQSSATLPASFLPVIGGLLLYVSREFKATNRGHLRAVAKRMERLKIRGGFLRLPAGADWAVAEALEESGIDQFSGRQIVGGNAGAAGRNLRTTRLTADQLSVRPLEQLKQCPTARRPYRTVDPALPAGFRPEPRTVRRLSATSRTRVTSIRCLLAFLQKEVSHVFRAASACRRFPSRGSL